MADAQDLKSWGRKKPCGFESHHWHHLENDKIGGRFDVPSQVNLIRAPTFTLSDCEPVAKPARAGQLYVAAATGAGSPGGGACSAITVSPSLRRVSCHAANARKAKALRSK